MHFHIRIMCLEQGGHMLDDLAGLCQLPVNESDDFLLAHHFAGQVLIFFLGDQTEILQILPPACPASLDRFIQKQASD